jgi:hypothetical protein
MRRRLVFVAVFSSLSLIAGGCMVGPKYVRPTTEQPTGFKSQPGSEAGPPIAADWWRLYADPELDQLIGTAQRSNPTLGRAVARVDEARALHAARKPAGAGPGRQPPDERQHPVDQGPRRRVESLRGLGGSCGPN